MTARPPRGRGAFRRAVPLRAPRLSPLLSPLPLLSRPVRPCPALRSVPSWPSAGRG